MSLSEESRPEFNYEEAFSRNLGWITEREREILRHKTVAIAGMGGVGGAHALTLARLGICHFHISDMDHFELANFNRQAGAFMSTLGKAKVEVMRDMILDINPEASVTVFDQGVNDENCPSLRPNTMGAFLEGVDLFIDGFDFFVLDIRMLVFRRCWELSIPAITAAPVGLGTALISFMPGGMSFDDYFGLKDPPLFNPTENLDEEELSYFRDNFREKDRPRYIDNIVRFYIGLTPKPLHKDYLVDPAQIDMRREKVASTPIGVQLSSGFLVAQTMKILLAREGVKAAPHYFLFDAYQGKLKKGRIWFGHKNPLQKIKFHLGRILYARFSKETPGVDEEQQGVADAETVPKSVLENILEICRWAPSGDNIQPWHFTLKTEKSLTLHVPAIEGDNPYEFDRGRPTYLSVGMLLETMRMAAEKYSLSMSWRLAKDCVWDGGEQNIAVTFRARKKAVKDELLSFVPLRSVLRFPFRTQAMSVKTKQNLQQELGDDLEIIWFEKTQQRLEFSRLNSMATDIRLRLEACFKIHTQVIDWQEGDSVHAIPATAVGMDSISLKLMKWTMQKWSRMDFINRYLGGTLLARIQLDMVPGYSSAAHFIILKKNQSKDQDTLEEILKFGAALQRFWLRASDLGLVLQPSMATLCFSHYARKGQDFSKGDKKLTAKAISLAQSLEDISGGRAGDIIFSGRIGYPKSGKIGARSVRKSVEDLLKAPERN